MSQRAAGMEEAETKPQIPKAIPEDIQEVVKNWMNILGRMPGMYKTYLQKARLSLGGDNVLLVVLEDEIGAEMLSQEDFHDEITGIVTDFIGKEVQLEFRAAPKEQSFESNYVDLSKIIHMEIEYEEDE